MVTRDTLASLYPICSGSDEQDVLALCPRNEPQPVILWGRSRTWWWIEPPSDSPSCLIILASSSLALLMVGSLNANVLGCLVVGFLSLLYPAMRKTGIPF